jgi:hypothetical protein
VLPIVLAILMVLTVLVPLMVFYTQRDSIWTAKQAANTHAFHVSEAGVEKAYKYISQSTATWNSLMAGQTQSGYNFDTSYADIDGGSYSLSVTSGPAIQEATIIAVGRDNLKREIRSLKVVYANTLAGNVAVYGQGGVAISGGVTVEWGAVMSPKSINANSLNYPQFWSASSITTFDTDPNPPNCDSPNCVQWHSYNPNIPSLPSIDFDFYRSSAQQNTTGGCPTGGSPAGSCYYVSTFDFTSNGNQWDTGSHGQTKGTVFIEGSMTAKNMYHIGNMIIMGNWNLDNGNFGAGSPTMVMPTNAWKQYGSPAASNAAWTHYKSWGDGLASFPGLNSSHSYTANVSDTKCALNGFMYVGNNMTDSGGGGNADVYGGLYVNGAVNIGAHSGVTVYFNSAATQDLATTNVILSRISWQDSTYGWPSGLH